MAPTVTALSVTAAEMAMMVRFNEDPDIFIFPFGSRLVRLLPNLFMNRANPGKLPFLYVRPTAQRRRRANLRQNVPSASGGQRSRDLRSSVSG